MTIFYDSSRRYVIRRAAQSNLREFQTFFSRADNTQRRPFDNSTFRRSHGEVSETPYARTGLRASSSSAPKPRHVPVPKRVDIYDLPESKGSSTDRGEVHHTRKEEHECFEVKSGADSIRMSGRATTTERVGNADTWEHRTH
jgi:hypothetical protein